MFVVQAEERNMYDQHWLSASLRERYPTLSDKCGFNVYNMGPGGQDFKP